MGTSISGWERVAMAIEEVRERLARCTGALEAAGVAYAVAGGNAVAEWVGRVEKTAVRFTQDVDIVIRRSDLDSAIQALHRAGFQYGESFGTAFFLDGPQAGPRGAVHLVFSGERVKASDVLPVPDVKESEAAESFRVVTLECLVQMKLTAFRRKDQVHLLDLLSVKLIDASWLARLPAPLAARLQELIDNPE
ncbi:MAG: hypothetical protein MUF48_13895 [Pirellulaceae bacterium]|jgi:hypothetical protein|nr:hypothetical protein [Pirellulaceae bacterium]